MIGYKSSSSVWCAWHVQILSCQCSNFPGGWKSSFQPPAGKKLEIKPGLKPGRLDMPELRSQCLRFQVPWGKIVFSYLFRCFFWVVVATNSSLKCQILETFFCISWGSNGYPQKTTTYNYRFYERYLKTTQPSTWNGWSNHLHSNAGHLRGGELAKGNSQSTVPVGAWMS